jgi:hypothetical protein
MYLNACSYMYIHICIFIYVLDLYMIIYVYIYSISMYEYECWHSHSWPLRDTSQGSQEHSLTFHETSNSPSVNPVKETLAGNHSFCVHPTIEQLENPFDNSPFTGLLTLYSLWSVFGRCVPQCEPSILFPIYSYLNTSLLKCIFRSTFPIHHLGLSIIACFEVGAPYLWPHSAGRYRRLGSYPDLRGTPASPSRPRCGGGEMMGETMTKTWYECC